MATTLKVLGQSKPGAATLTDTYTVPGATQAVCSSIIATNQSATPTAIRVSVAVAGAADTAKQYIAYDVPIGANETVTIVVGVSLGAADVIRCYCTLATVSFNVFGQETT
jgi:hypothetical protein